VQGTGPWNGDLRNEPAVRADEVEIRHIDRRAPAHAAVDERNRLRGASARLAALGVLAADGVDADLPELAIKETVVGAATEFAVGRELEPHAALERQRVLDGFVFGLGQLRPVDFAAREFCTLIEQLARPQQATDMFGMEWRRVVRQHRRQASLGFSRTALEGAGTTGPYLGVIGVGRSAADSVAGCPLTCNRPVSTAQGIAAGRHQCPDDSGPAGQP